MRGWSPAAALHDPRFNAAMVLLRDGRALAAGGADDLSPNFLSSTELYDPSRRRWTRTGDLRQNRQSYTATLLPDGRVIAVGGIGTVGDHDPPFPQELSSAELYDPRTGRWMSTGDLAQNRFEHMATLLRDGRVLVVGGRGVVGVKTPRQVIVLSSVEVYNPRTGRWTRTGSLYQPRADATATLLQDGRVLVVGGIGHGQGGVLASVELYDSRAGRWTRTASLLQRRAYHTATLLRDGRVLVAGGEGAHGPLADAEIYNPHMGRWARTATMHQKRNGHTATLLPSGQVLVVGGSDDHRSLSDAELYDPRTGRWVRVSNLHQGRSDRYSPTEP